MPLPYPLTSIKSQALDEIQRLRTRFGDITPLLFQPGEYLIKEGDRSQDIFIVLHGTFEVVQASAGRGMLPTSLAKVTCSVRSFAIVGEMAYLGNHPRTASIRALEPTHTLCMRPFHLDAMMEDCPLLTKVLCQQFAHRLRETNEALRESRAREF